MVNSKRDWDRQKIYLMWRDSTKIIIWASSSKWEHCLRTNNSRKLVHCSKELQTSKNKWCQHKPNSQAEKWLKQWLGLWVDLLVDPWLEGMIKLNCMRWFSNWKIAKIMVTPKIKKYMTLHNKTNDLRKKSMNSSLTFLPGMLNQPMKISKSTTNSGNKKLGRLNKTTSSRWTILGNNWWKDYLTKPLAQVSN